MTDETHSNNGSPDINPHINPHINPLPGKYTPSMNGGFFRDTTSAPMSDNKNKFRTELGMSRSFDDFSTRVKSFLLDRGFTHYGLIRVETKIPSLKASMQYSYEAAPLHMISSPHQMTDIYFEKKLYGLDMVLNIARNDNGPFFQSMIKDFVKDVPFMTGKIRENREICKLYEKFGHDDLYYVPLGEHTGNDNGRVVLYVGIEDMDGAYFKAHIKRCKHVVRDLGDAINYVGTRKFPDSFLFLRKTQEIKITPRPLRVLETLAADDLTLLEAAEKLGISIHTADKHSAAVRSALNTRTIQGAVYKAKKLGLIQ